MQPKWKKTFLWSSIGGISLGTAAAAVIRARRKSRPRPLQFRKIPSECTRVTLWTQRFQQAQQGSDCTAHDTYVLEATPFKLWSVLQLHAGSEGSAIYHITHRRCLDPVASGLCGEEQILQRFYATVAVQDMDGKQHGRNLIARGGILVLSKCLVGGAENGIETGEVHRSEAPILNFRFEAVPDGDARSSQGAGDVGRPVPAGF